MGQCFSDLRLTRQSSVMAARELLVDSSDKVCLSVSSSVWRVSRRLAFLILGVSDLEEVSSALKMSLRR